MHSIHNGIATLQKPDCDSLIVLFDRLFLPKYNTRLVKGGHEPEYQPAKAANEPHQIMFTQDYLSSALHEIAHWCIAGKARRLQTDYGYWYAPDGRNQSQQQRFEQVEVKPQALEWLFSRAAGVRFRVSADNVEAGLGASNHFTQAIVKQVHDYCLEGVNRRASLFIEALCLNYPDYSIGESCVFAPESYRLQDV